MGKNLYPLIYKPGILKDGTLFQGDYCTDGQWVRFRNGNVRKMGGMLGSANHFIRNLQGVSNITMLPAPNKGDSILTYICAANGTIQIYNLNQLLQVATRRAIRPPQGGASKYIWNSTKAIQGANQRIVFLGSPSKDNIFTDTNSVLVCIQVDANVNNNTIIPIISNPDALGVVTPLDLNGAMGVLFKNPWLFVYGANGKIQWSTKENIVDFTNASSREISVGYDKIIDLRAIRGGVNSPTLLCWTLTSVVRLINTSNSDDTLDFQTDVLTSDTSILSSRCVIERRGVFYWPGTNQFYTFNGVVGDLKNNINLDSFYENLDLDNRQLVFGVKNTEYDELHWFYPEKGQIGTVKNTRCVTYNIEENTWYDSAISRDAGVYSEDFGFMATYGTSLTTPGADLTLYRHEAERFAPPNLKDFYINEHIPDVNETTKSVPILSFFTTPTISWASFNPMKQLTGVDKWMDIITLEPDFAKMPQNTDMTVTVNTRQFAQDFPISSQPYIINSPLLSAQDDPNDAKTDMAFQGREVTLTFSTTKNFYMGHIMLQIGLGDGQ